GHIPESDEPFAGIAGVVVGGEEMLPGIQEDDIVKTPGLVDLQPAQFLARGDVPDHKMLARITRKGGPFAIRREPFRRRPARRHPLATQEPPIAGIPSTNDIAAHKADQRLAVRRKSDGRSMRQKAIRAENTKRTGRKPFHASARYRKSNEQSARPARK